jgi:hypothetical protein
VHGSSVTSDEGKSMNILFSSLFRTVPRTKGRYYIGYLLLLQLDCSVYTCGQLQNLRIAGVL